MNVDAQNYTVNVDVNSEGSHREIQCAAPYFNSTNGGGFVFVPATGTLCIVAEMDDSEYVVLGFIAGQTEGLDNAGNPVAGTVGYKNDRPDWNTDDLGIIGPVDNHVKVESSGVIHIQASPFCQAYFVPDPVNMIKAFADNLDLSIGNSYIKFINNRVSKTTDLEIYSQKVPDSDAGAVKIQIGNSGDVLKILVDDQVVFQVESNRKIVINNNLTIRPN